MYDLSKNKGKPNINLTFYVRFSMARPLWQLLLLLLLLLVVLLFFLFPFALVWPLETFCALSLGKVKYAIAAAIAAASPSCILSSWVRAMSCGMSNKRASHQLYGQITQITEGQK